MGVLHSPESPYAKEAVKWEAQFSAYGPPGKPYVFHEFPKMVYKAGRTKTGVPEIMERAIVENEQAERNLKSRDFFESQEDAIAALHANDTALAELAANRAYQDKRLSEPARREVEAFDNSTAAHVAEVPVTPIRRAPGRPRKVAP